MPKSTETLFPLRRASQATNALLASILPPLPPPPTRVNASPKGKGRASRKPQHDDPPDMKSRIEALGKLAVRIMAFHGGNMLEGRRETLERLEKYYRDHNQPPIRHREEPGEDPDKTWDCTQCPRSFKTFQKVAIHVTSHHWRLRSWFCSW